MVKIAYCISYDISVPENDWNIRTEEYTYDSPEIRDLQILWVMTDGRVMFKSVKTYERYVPDDYEFNGGDEFKSS
jgi:hypothetical protein